MHCRPTIIKIQTLLVFFVGPVVLGLLVGGITAGAMIKGSKTLFAFTQRRNLVPSDHVFPSLAGDKNLADAPSFPLDAPLYYEVNCHGVTRHWVTYQIYACKDIDVSEYKRGSRTIQFSGRRRSQYDINLWEDAQVLSQLYSGSLEVMVKNVGKASLTVRGLGSDDSLVVSAELGEAEQVAIDYFAAPKLQLLSSAQAVEVQLSNIPTIDASPCDPVTTVTTLCADNKRIRSPLNLTFNNLASTSDKKPNGPSFILFKEAGNATQFDNGVNLALNITNSGSILLWEIVIISVTVGIIAFSALHCSSCCIINRWYKTIDPLVAHHGIGHVDRNDASQLYTEVESWDSGVYS